MAPEDLCTLLIPCPGEDSVADAAKAALSSLGTDYETFLNDGALQKHLSLGALVGRWMPAVVEYTVDWDDDDPQYRTVKAANVKPLADAPLEMPFKVGDPVNALYDGDHQWYPAKVAEGGVNNGVQQAELWSQSHASRKDLRHSGDTTILLHILNHGSDMQREQRLTDRLSNYGTVLAATIRSRPEEDSSWALVTFATSTEVAKVLEDGKMLAAEGLIAEQTDEHLAFSSTGAMRDVASTHRNRVSKRYLADSGRDKGLTLSFADAMLDGLVYDQYEKPDFEKTPWQHWVRGYGQSVALLEQDARPVPDERAVLLSVLVCWAGYNIAIDGEHLDADDKEAARLARESSPHYLLLRGLAQAQLTGTYMRGAELDDAILHGACLQHCDLQEAVLTRASLQEARLEYSNLNDASLDHADIREAHLEHANLATASLKRANLYTTRLEHADLRGACLEHANLKEARLEHADLRGADLRWANLSGANLTSANLSGAQLQHANLDGAQLQLANLREAQLQNARLDRAQLQHADLSSANLEQASFQGSHLQYARMENVNLNNAQHVETAEFSPMPPVARRRRATEKSWALQLRHTIIGMPHDELDEEEYDEENDGEDAETRTNTLGPKDTFEQEPSLGLDNPIAGKGDDSQSAACFEGILIGGFTLNVLTEGRLRNVANTPIELASRLTKINIQLILVDATEMRTTLDTRIVSILEDHATRSKAIFLLRTTPLSIQYTRWCDAQTRDLRDADAERRAFLVIAEDWFLFAAAITAAAHALSARQLKKFVEEAYARVLRGEEKLKQGSELKFVGEHPDQLSLLALCEHKLAQTTAAEVHRTEIALIVQTKYAARGLLPATKALLFSTRKMSTDLKELEYLMLHLERLQSSVDVTNWDDCLDTWISLGQLPRKLHGEKALMVLEQIFLEDDLRAAIGMAFQLKDMQRGDLGAHIPDGFLRRFKRFANIKMLHFGFVKALNTEITNINRIRQRQRAAFQTANSVLMAGMVTFGQYLLDSGHVNLDVFGGSADD